MTDQPGPRALQEFIESLAGFENVDQDVRDVVERLHNAGSLNADALVAALRELRAEEGQDGATSTH